MRLCLRGRWDAAALGTTRTLSQEAGLDWDAIREAAQREGVAPLLYAIARGRALLPPTLEEELRRAYFANARRNLLLFNELACVLRELEARGISAIVLKGAALAEAVYGNLAVRPMGDVDVLVRRADVPRALAALADMRYVITHIEKNVGYKLVYDNEVMLRKFGALDIVLEIHWNLLYAPYYRHILALDWFWETAIPLRMDALTTRMLGPEAQLLHLCGHAHLQHGREAPRLLWLHDIAEVLVAYRETLDWETLLRQARAFDLTLPVRRLLLRVTEEWRLPLPAAALARVRALTPSAREAQVFAELTAPERPFTVSFWDDLAGMPDWRTRLGYVWRNFWPATAYMRTRYAIRYPWLTPFYYPYRWWVGLRELLRSRGLMQRTGR